MKNKISIRQILFLFIFISITPIFSYLPNVCAANAENTGYISAIYGGILLFIFGFLLLQILKAYPNENLYDILKKLLGEGAAKCIIFLYGIWALLYLTFKVNSYTILLQTTLLPSINTGILIVFLFLLVIYAMLKGVKTVFRFAEFLYVPVLFFLLVLFIFSFRSMNTDYLLPFTAQHFIANVKSIPDICSIGGNLTIMLFFSESLFFIDSYQEIKKRIYMSITMFTLFCGAAIFFVLTICGYYLTSEFNYPVFQAVKSISFLDTFERFDSFITLICVLSDFTAICIFLLIVFQCFRNLFKTKYHFNIGIILFIIACSFVMIHNATQVELNSFYFHIMIYVNLIFQYVIPVPLGIVSIFKLRRSGGNKRNINRNV